MGEEHPDDRDIAAGVKEIVPASTAEDGSLAEVSADGSQIDHSDVEDTNRARLEDKSVVVPDPSVGVPEPRPNIARRWSKVESVSVKNFKAIKETKVPLGEVTILVGPNGSGKSSALQAIHWEIRASSHIEPKYSKEMRSFDRLDYLPSSEPLKTAHKGELGSNTTTEPTTIAFNHAAIANEDPAPSAVVKIFAERNRGGITVHIEGGTAVSPYKQRDTFLTAYIPGLAGLSERKRSHPPDFQAAAFAGIMGSVRLARAAAMRLQA